MPTLRYLHDGWTLQPADSATDVRQVPATVPGCVHTDLQAAGVIPDPYLDRNEHELRWIGESDWRYTTTFNWNAADAGQPERVDLVCEGLDTIATVELNGEVVSRTRNAHRSYRIPVDQALRDGENELVVTFGSPVRYARQMYDSHGRLPKHQPSSAEPFNYIRKMSSDFGWDWGPVLPTSGIWKPIALHAWKIARFAGVRPIVTTADGTGRVELAIDLERTQTLEPLRLSARIAGAQGSVDVPTGATTSTIELEVADPDLWWPHTHGAQPLYELRVECWHGDDRLDEWQSRIGFRTVEIDTSPDEIGSAFTIVVNGRPIFARGANWAPDDCFPSRVDAARYRRRLQQAKEASIDLFRINGVGLYEQDALYDAADELGILIWQDFTLSCATYPEEEPYLQEIEAEARENVARLMPHPSLILWNGTNENLWGYYDWGWRDQLGDRPWGKRYYFEIFPRVVEEVDPTRPYWPGSPYSGAFERHPNLPQHGTTHDWNPWIDAGPEGFRDQVPRFAAEYGFLGPPTWATLTRAIHDDPLTPRSLGVLSHNKAFQGPEQVDRWLEACFGLPETMDDWHWLAQLNQARALTIAIEHYRSHRGHCMGSAVWSLNDPWPVTSWSLIDGDGRRKPAWYALRRAYADRLLTVQPRGAERLVAFAVNDSATAWQGEITCTARDLDGTVQHEATAGTFVALPYAKAEVELPTLDTELLVVEAGEWRTFWFAKPDKDLPYPRAEYDVEVLPGNEVQVTARTLLRDLALFADRLDPAAGVDDLLVTLLPGESHTFRIDGLSRPVSLEEVSRPPVLRCVNDLP